MARALLTRPDSRFRLVRGGIGVAGIQVLNRVLTLALAVLLSRALGPKGYGVYAYAFAIMSLLMVAAEAGVPNLLMREVAAAQGLEEWSLLRGALQRAGQFVSLISISIALIGLIVLTEVAGRLQPTVVYTTGLMLLVLPLAALSKTVAQAMRGLHRIVIGQAVDMLLRPMLVLSLVFAVFLLWPEFRKPQIAMAVQFVAALVTLIVGGLVLQRFKPVEARDIRATYRSRQWLKSALPFTLIGGAGIINNQADILMLGWFRSAHDVGLYRVATQGSMLVAFGLQAATTLIAPHFARLHARGERQRLQQLVTHSARVVLIAALPVALVFIFGGGLILHWVFGADYAAAHLPLAILAVGQMINAAFGSVGFLLNMTGHENIVARILWQTAALNIALNAMLIPACGMTGAAIASIVSLGIWNAALHRQVRQRLLISSTALKANSR